MHTVTLHVTMTFNVDAMIEICRGRKSQRVSIERINSLGISKSKLSGFSLKRYDAASLKYPLIVSPDFELFDGRHRLFKAMALGRKFINVVILTYEELLTTVITEDV